MKTQYLIATTIATCLLTHPVLADLQYGIDVGQSELKFMIGQHTAAVDLELGRAGTPDYARAALHYRKAAVLGFPPAQNSLGRLYEMGRGVPQDYSLSHMWYTLAAAAGDEIAVSNRDASAKRLPDEQVLRAQKLASQLDRQLP